MKKTLAIVNVVALVSTVFLNYLSNSGAFNGNTMKTVSDRYFNLFTPAGYAFSIWGLIYLGLFSFTIYTGKSLLYKQEPHPALAKVGWWFLVSCVANSFWVVAWLYNYILLSVGLMVLILVSLIRIAVNLNISLTKESTLDRIFIRLPFTLYMGWISVALIANLAAFLTKTQWNGFGIAASFWTILMIGIAGLINIYMVAKRNMIAYGLVGIWALMAIAANQSSSAKSILYTCYGVSAAILLAILFNFRKTFR